MCGGYSLGIDYKKLAKRFNTAVPKFTYPVRYNIRPGQQVPTIFNNSPKEMNLGYWGFIPHWAKGPSDAIINTRKDSLATKATFKDSFEHRRCLILADGFYEWAKGGTQKTPYRIVLASGEPFAFAGIWKPGKSQELNEVSIITTEPNSEVAKIHNRMPAILQPDIEREWLRDDLSDKDLLEILLPYPTNEVKIYEISRLVNSARNDMPEIIEPIVRLG